MMNARVIAARALYYDRHRRPGLPLPDGRPTDAGRAEVDRIIRRHVGVGTPALRTAPAWSILAGDCLELMAGLPSGCARLAVADPPYDFGVRYGAGFDDRRGRAAFHAWLMPRLAAAARLLAPDGSLWVLLPHEHAARVSVGLEDAGLHRIQTVTWFESFGVNATAKFNRCSRVLLWFSPSPRTRLLDPARPELRVPSARAAVYGDRRAANGGTKLCDDVWRDVPRLAGTHRERLPWAATQLPLALLRRVAAASSDPGDLVLDPFCGSGTAGVASVGMGRRFVGMELNPDRAALAALRVMTEGRRR